MNMRERAKDLLPSRAYLESTRPFATSLAEQRRFWHATLAASETDDAERPGRE